MKIVCLGDSLTEGYLVKPEECWVSLLQRETGEDWINAGVSGDTSGGMLARLVSEVFPLAPDAVLLMGGDNDIMISGSPLSARENLMSMVNLCASRGIQPVVGIPMPMRVAPGNPWLDFLDMETAAAESAAQIQWLRRFTDAFCLRRVDFCAALAQGGTSLLLPDGMHPTAAGHRLMAEAVKSSGFFCRRL